MESVRKCERELGLERCMDSLVDEMNGKYGADLAEEARIDAMMGDLVFRDDLIKVLKEVIRCKKISERIMAEERKDVEYSIGLRAASGRISFSIARNCLGGSAPPK